MKMIPLQFETTTVLHPVMSSIDVIVPCYNYARFLKECVDSVLAGGVPETRVLIINDASPDDTAIVANGLAQADSRVSVIHHPTNRGHIATYNEGIAWASADYLLVLSADDYLLPDALRRAVDVLEAHPEIGFVFGNVINSAESGLRAPMASPSQATPKNLRVMTGREFIKLIAARKTINLVPTATAVVRTKLQKQVGGYRPDLPHAGDLEMWLRLAAHACVGMMATCQAVYRRHDQNMQLSYYSAKCGLSDLEQRLAAVNSFYESSKTVLAEADALRRELILPLAQQSLELAHAAFNAGDPGTAGQFARLAVTVAPRLKFSPSWLLLSGKNHLGSRSWRRLQPVRARMKNLLPRRIKNVLRRMLGPSPAKESV
jgi:hypothetical protein